MDRKLLKKNAKQTIHMNYKNIVLVCFFIAFFASGYLTPSLDLTLATGLTETVSTFRAPTLSAEIEKMVLGFLDNKSVKDLEITAKKNIHTFDRKFNLSSSSEGALSKVVNQATRSGSFLVGILSALNQFLFNSAILENTLMSISAVLIFIYWFLVENIIAVGECRFFLETKQYHKSKLNRILFIYQVNKTFHVAYIMLKKFVLHIAWFLTIFGGFIKIYSYAMVPYILAENPSINSKDVFKLSMAMMKKQKWSFFLLDLSFLGWQILNVFTLGILGFLYINPYARATKTEAYFFLREKAIADNLPLAHYLKDELLVTVHPDEKIAYPTGDYFLDSDFLKGWFKLNEQGHYEFISYIYMFFIFAFIGWVWEVVLFLFQTGSFVNRGTMFGPWLPIYGTGGVAIVFFLKRWANNPFLLFGFILLLCGVLEYTTSYVLELFFHERWWDYSNYFLNFDGRICLEGLLFFGIGGILFVYILAPFVDEIVDHMPKHFKIFLSLFLTLFFVVDFSYSTKHPNKGDGITAQPLKVSTQTSNPYIEKAPLPPQ